jgi:hypothetical protein
MPLTIEEKTRRLLGWCDSQDANIMHLTQPPDKDRKAKTARSVQRKRSSPYMPKQIMTPPTSPSTSSQSDMV